MNFIGHLYIARLRRDDPAFGLGAMLPDFASMARLRLGAPSSESLASGIRLHHATDDVFHHAPPFLALMADAFTALTERGAARGPARAVAHIGVEMLLDGELLANEALDEPYLEALNALERHRTELAPDPDAKERLGLLHERLKHHGVPHDYRNTEAVVWRLTRMLSGRKRLALDETARAATSEVLPQIRVAVAARAEEIVTLVARELPKEAVLVR